MKKLLSAWSVPGAVLALACVTLLAAGAEDVAPPIVPPGAVPKKLCETKVLTEGGAVAPDGQVYFSEITFSHRSRDEQGSIEAGFIWHYDPSTGTAEIFRSPSGMSNGIKFDAAGNMIVAEGADFGGRRVTRTDMVTGKARIIAALHDGRPLNSPNDITIDEKGRIYFSDPRYAGHEPIDQPLEAVYRSDTDGSLHRIITDAGKPNGVCISPDQKTLYVVSNDNGGTAIGQFANADGKGTIPLRKGLMALLAYDLHDDGSATFRKTLVDYAPFDGGKSVRRCPRGEPPGNLRLFPRREGARLHPHRGADERRIRSRQGCLAPLHHGRGEPVFHPGQPRGLSPAGSQGGVGRGAQVGLGRARINSRARPREGAKAVMPTPPTLPEGAGPPPHNNDNLTWRLVGI